jgi:hypothetical protein
VVSEVVVVPGVTSNRVTRVKQVDLLLICTKLHTLMPSGAG